MYLAKLATDEGDWVQAIVTVRETTQESSGVASRRADELARLMERAASTPQATVTRRVAIDSERRLTQAIAVMAPADQERRVREFFAGLTRLERASETSVRFPLNSEEHDAVLAKPPPLRFCTTSQSFSVTGVPVACNFRVASALDDILLDACASGFAVTYQIHVRATNAPPEWVRAARRNVLALEALPGAHPRLIAWQDELARAMSRTCALCEEYLAVESSDAATSLAVILQERFRARFTPLGFNLPTLRFEPDTHDESLLLGVHSHDLGALSPADACGVSLDDEERRQLLTWRPSEKVRSMLQLDQQATPAASPHVEAAEALDEPTDLPEPYDGDGPYAFVSYKRQDLRRIAPILRQMAEEGLSIWYDRGIPGGSEWDDIIEQRLTRCRMVLLFVSPAALESKYVRREVKFADVLAIPLVSVVLDDVQPGYGMRMLLTQYQMLDARRSDFRRQLQRTLASLR